MIENVATLTRIPPGAFYCGYLQLSRIPTPLMRLDNPGMHELQRQMHVLTGEHGQVPIRFGGLIRVLRRAVYVPPRVSITHSRDMVYLLLEYKRKAQEYTNISIACSPFDHGGSRLSRSNKRPQLLHRLCGAHNQHIVQFTTSHGQRERKGEDSPLAPLAHP